MFLERLWEYSQRNSDTFHYRGTGLHACGNVRCRRRHKMKLPKIERNWILLLVLLTHRTGVSAAGWLRTMLLLTVCVCVTNTANAQRQKHSENFEERKKSSLRTRTTINDFEYSLPGQHGRVDWTWPQQPEKLPHARNNVSQTHTHTLSLLPARMM